MNWLDNNSEGLGIVWPFIFAVGALFFTNFDTWNPLLWRSFNQDNAVMQWYVKLTHTNDFSNHHFLNYAILGILSLSITYFFWKKKGGSFLKWGRIATYGVFLCWIYHEGYWWPSYLLNLWTTGQPWQWIWFSGMGEIMLVALLIFTPVLGLFFPWRFLIAMGIFYVAWLAVGFPITESYLGNTPLYLSVWANAWEDGSWMYAAVAFYILEKNRLLEWFERVRTITNQKALSEIQNRNL